MSNYPIPLLSRAPSDDEMERDRPSTVLTRAARSLATRRQQTVVDVLHGRALQHYAAGLTQYLAIHLGSAALGTRAFLRLRAVVASASSESLVAAPGIRAHLYRLARLTAADLADEASGHGDEGELPYREGQREHRQALSAIRALPSEDRELLELRFARELTVPEIACVLALDVDDVRERINAAHCLARHRVPESLRPGAQVETLLLQAFALELPHALAQARGPAPSSDEAALNVDSPSLLTGRIIAGRYAIEARVGSGAFGDVYRARDTEVRGHVVALKILHQPSPSDEERERALRELRLIASVFHPSIVQFKDHGWHEGRLWFVMPWYEGETLEDRIEREPLTRKEAQAIFEPLARALASMHARGIRHQDIKPENIFLATLPGDDAPLPVLLDLGVAAEDAEMVFAGTPTYFAPEVACQFASVDEKPPVGHAADVFALALALRNALEPSTQEDIPAGAVETFIETRARIVPEMPRNPQLRFLEPSWTRWMALSADERPTAAAFAEELSVLSLPERRRARRRKAVAVGLPLTLAMLLVAGLSVEHMRQRELASALEISRAEATAAGLRDNLLHTQAHVEQLRGRVEAGTFSRQELQLSLAAHSQRLHASEAQVGTLRTAMESMRVEAEALRGTLDERRQRVTGLERDLESLTQEGATLTRRLEERRQELAAQERALDEARRALRESRSAESQARSEVDTTLALVAAERARADALALSIARLNSTRSRLEEERDDAQEALRRAQAELRALRGRASGPAGPAGAEDSVPEDGGSAEGAQDAESGGAAETPEAAHESPASPPRS